MEWDERENYAEPTDASLIAEIYVHTNKIK